MSVLAFILTIISAFILASISMLLSKECFHHHVHLRLALCLSITFIYVSISHRFFFSPWVLGKLTADLPILVNTTWFSQNMQSCSSQPCDRKSVCHALLLAIPLLGVRPVQKTEFKILACKTTDQNKPKRRRNGSAEWGSQTVLGTSTASNSQ